MIRHLIQLLIFCPLLASSQLQTGIAFNQSSTWPEIQAQAKNQRKFILVDCYTTWCGPCKWLDSHIFSEKEAGDSINKYFVSVRVQMDTTKSDSGRVKNWYPVAHQFYKEYSIEAFPTLLFFTSDGELAHRFVGASQSVREFIDLTQQARDSATQYYTMRKKYLAGYRDSSFLEGLSNAGYNFESRELMGAIGDDLLTTQKDPLSKHNLDYTGHLLKKGNSRTFNFFLHHTPAIDSVMGNDYAERKLMNIMIDEYTEMDNAGNKSGLPDWDAMSKTLKNKYGSYYADRITGWRKIAYFYEKNAWKEFDQIVIKYILGYKNTLGNLQLNNLLWGIFQHSNVKSELEQAALWSKETLQSDEQYLNEFYDTYANLLFKLSRKKEAIEAEEMAIELSPEEKKEQFRKTLRRMQK